MRWMEGLDVSAQGLSGFHPPWMGFSSGLIGSAPGIGHGDRRTFGLLVGRRRTERISCHMVSHALKIGDEPARSGPDQPERLPLDAVGECGFDGDSRAVGSVAIRLGFEDGVALTRAGGVAQFLPERRTTALVGLQSQPVPDRSAEGGEIGREISSPCDGEEDSMCRSEAPPRSAPGRTADAVSRGRCRRPRDRLGRRPSQSMPAMTIRAAIAAIGRFIRGPPSDVSAARARPHGALADRRRG